MEKDSKIYLAGHSGFVGSALLEELKNQGYNNIAARSSKELNLQDADATKKFFLKEKPEYVFLAAAKAGGIKGIMDNPVEFLRNNIQIYTNVLEGAYRIGVKKLLFLGSSCTYPIDAQQPFKEETIIAGKFEPNIEPFAIAKAYGTRLCQAYNREYGTNFIVAVPATLYGLRDNFYDEGGHFTPALIRRLHEAKEEGGEKVVIWGSGNPRREVLHVNDAVKAFIFLMNNYDSSEPINVGAGSDISIREFSEILKKVIDYTGELYFDTTKPDGAMEKFMDSGKIKALGWKPEIELEQGLRETYKWFLENY